MTIAQAGKLFMEDRAVYCSAKTLRSYACHLQVFYHFLEARYRQPVTLLEFGSLPPGDNIYSGFILFQRGRVKNSTIRSYCRTIKVFLRWCYEGDYCRDYLKKVKLPRDDAIPKMPLYTDEVAAIDSVFDAQTIKGIRNYCIFHLMLDCGLRRVHAHLLRHTFATSYLIGGGNLEFLRVFLGHTDYNVTKVYSQLAAKCKMLGVDVYRLDPVFFTRGY